VSIIAYEYIYSTCECWFLFLYVFVFHFNEVETLRLSIVMDIWMFSCIMNWKIWGRKLYNMILISWLF